MNILIADDERPARGELQYLLSQLESTATFYEATNGQEVLTALADHPVDVVFLDINMPGMNGLATAAEILQQPAPPLIVFATAYDAYAVRAFELAALDYVVKPIAEERLARTMVRLRSALTQQTDKQTHMSAVRDYVTQAREAAPLAKLWTERENKTNVLVDYSDILWIVAEEKRVCVQTSSGELLNIRQTLKDLEPRLVLHNIIRVHKAYLVNLDHVTEVVPWFSGTYVLRMADSNATEIPMSRQYAKALKERLD